MGLRKVSTVKKWNSLGFAPEGQKELGHGINSNLEGDAMIYANACSNRNKWMKLLAINDESTTQTVGTPGN